MRRFCYRAGCLSRVHLPVPVIVVGNISVGGTGKTPLVIALVELLRNHGYSPGVTTRGYGGENITSPQPVTVDSDPYAVSDEAVLLAMRGRCPVVVGRDRVAAAILLHEQGCDVVLSDDGLQHYRLWRDIEIAVIDGARGLGNGYLLPAGPLREPPRRLREVDFVVVNGTATDSRDYSMTLVPQVPRRLSDQLERPLASFGSSPVHAIAGIGNPQRFFDALASSGLQVIPHAFPDHYRYQRKELDFGDDYPVLMTEKDAVKCRRLVDNERYFYIAVDALLDERLEPQLMQVLAARNDTIGRQG